MGGQMNIGDTVAFDDGHGATLFGRIVEILPGDFLRIDPASHPGHLSLLMVKQVLYVL